MFPSRNFLVACGGCAWLCAAAFADTVVLKSGDKLEGKILSETATEVVIDVKVSAGIADQQTVLRDTIAKIEKEQPDELAWQSLKGLALGANSLPPAQYEVVMRPLEGFIREYPQSAHKADAAAILAKFAEEKKRVDDGDVRLGSKWLSEEEAAVERYQIDAQLAFQYMRQQASAGDLIGALNSFGQIDASFNGARVYPDAVDTAKSTLIALKTTLERAKTKYQTDEAEFQKGVANSAPQQKAELLAARKREQEQGEAAVAAASRNKSWPVLVPRSEKNLAALAQKVTGEQARLGRIDVAKMRQSIQLAEQAKKEIADKKVEAEQTLGKAADLWDANELVKRLRPALAELRTAANIPPPAATPEPATPKPTPSTPAPTVAEDLAPIEPQEDETPFFMTPGGIIVAIVILAVITAGVIAYKKVTKKASEVLE